MSTQLPLDLPLAPDYSADAFVTGECHIEAKTTLNGWQNWANNILALVGPKGSGKTHLASIWGVEQGAISAPDAGFEMPLNTLVWVDNAASADGQSLFRLINLALEGRIAGLLLIDRERPAVWPYGFPDLHSRFKNISTTQLCQPDDALMRAIITKLFKDRGLKVSDALIQYLLTHAPRSVDDLRIFIHQLDTHAAREKINVTRSLAAKLLQTEKP